MLFNSPTFIVFLFVVFCLYWAIRRREPQNVLLLIASYVFYGAWSWKFLLLLIAGTLLDYTWGLLIAASEAPRRRRYLLLGSLTLNLSILGVFKYLGFFLQETAELLASLHMPVNIPVLHIVLPVGISFYTFQSMAYTIDVYRRKIPAERNLLQFALYIAFFPQLVAGPIERAAHMLPQYKAVRQWSGSALESGLQLAVWGLFKKIVIADRLTAFVDDVYANPSGFSGMALVTATVFFAVQIYCDFSGYTDTARGVARMLGFDLVRNFDHPYISRNPVEFWQRWHMSLSQWFQDYLYFPLAMHYVRKGGWAGRYKAHIISMGLIGLWHGASWTFIVFGLYWGLVIALYLFGREQLAARGDSNRLARGLGATSHIRSFIAPLAMFAIVCVGWIFFRAQSLVDAFYVLRHLSLSTVTPDGLPAAASIPVGLWGLIVLLVAAEWIQRNHAALSLRILAGRFSGLTWRYAVLVAIMFSYATSREGAQPFIYFQF